MQTLILAKSSVVPYKIDFKQPFIFAGNTLNQRTGFYLTLTSTTGLSAQGEVSPLPGVSVETDKRVKHDLEEIQPFLSELNIATGIKALIEQLRHEPHVINCCSSVRFGLESAIFNLAALNAGQSLVEFLGGNPCDVPTAALLQGTHTQVIDDAKRMSALGYRIFKLKVGDRNIALDVKKVQDLRVFLSRDAMLRLDGNRVWSLKEALIFVDLAGRDKIEFIEEPLSEPSHLGEFYQQTHMPIALDETLSVIRCGVSAPGRCSPTLANSDGVKVFVLKPTILGGIIPTLDWIEDAHSQGKKAILSSAFESPVGLKVLANLACLTEQTAGLGTERWFKGVQPIVNESGIIPSLSLQ